VFIGSPATLQGLETVRQAWDSTISKLTDPVDPKFVEQVQRSTLVQPVPEKFFETLVDEALKVPARVWKQAFKAFLEGDLFSELSKIRAPTLIVWGDQDAILTRKDQEALAGAIVDSRLMVYGGAGHSPHWEQPDRFTSDLVAFIKDLAK
jgi:non-heme chloroperoxidase